MQANSKPQAGNPEPEAASRPFDRDEFISHIRKTLLTNPNFTRLYASILESEGVNPNQAKIIAQQYLKNYECHPEEGAFCPTKDLGEPREGSRSFYLEKPRTMNHAHGSLPYPPVPTLKISGVPMSQPNVRSCTHIKVNGIPCGSPALRGERFCYYHQRVIRGVRTPPRARLHPIAIIEDPQSIQFALMEVINALMRDTIDVKRANVILRALHIAVKNMQNRNYVSFADRKQEMIRDIPDYPETATADEPNPADENQDINDLEQPQNDCDMPITASYPPATDHIDLARRRYEEKSHGITPMTRDEILSLYCGPSKPRPAAARPANPTLPTPYPATPSAETPNSPKQPPQRKPAASTRQSSDTQASTKLKANSRR
jgi:hypothetical protein